MTTHTGKLNLKTLLFLLPVLLLVAIAVNYESIMSIVKGERSFKSVVYGLSQTGDSEFGIVPMPNEPIGSEKAKVIIDVFLLAGDMCHIDSIFLGKALGTVEPERIKIVFNDTSSPVMREKFLKMKLGCEQGMAVNGQVKFKVPNTPNSIQGNGPLQTKMGPVSDGKSEPNPNAKEKTIYLTGGHEMKWSMTDLHFILDKALKAAYKNKGMNMSADQFAEKVKNEQKAIMDAAREAAKLAKESGVEQTPRDIMPTLDVKERSIK